MDDIIALKVIVAGPTGVGKTFLCNCLTDSTHISGTTIGVEYIPFWIDIGPQRIKVDIWDLGGHPAFGAITDSYAENAVGCVIVVDITDRRSVTDARIWWERVYHLFKGKIPRVLIIGNKEDLKFNKLTRDSHAIQTLISHTKGQFLKGSLKENPAPILREFKTLIASIVKSEDLKSSEGYRILERQSAYRPLDEDRPLVTAEVNSLRDCRFLSLANCCSLL